MANSGVGGLRRLGRYHLAEPLGGGPTGEVFRAKVYGVAGFERQFAVKRFHTQFVIDPETAARVSTAARSYGSLEHPRIARLHEYGVAQGHTFTATELIIGLDLARLVGTTYGAGEPLVTGAAAAVISQAARAVGYAHGRGICHFGVCPTNLICTPEGEVKVTDFGFLPPRLPARPAEDPSLGARIPYLAPEQIVGEATSSATDVYQLGVVAHELFSGEQCFRGGTPLDIAQAILSGPLEEPQLPKPLLKVLRRSVARSPFERFPDAGAFADAFDAAVRATPLPGGSRDIGGVVRAAMQRLAEMNENQVSGALSFPLPAPPRAPTSPARPDTVPSPSPSLSQAAPSADSAAATPISQLLKQPPTGPGVEPLRKTLMGLGNQEPEPSEPSLTGADPEEDRVTKVRKREMGFVNVTTPAPLAGAAASGGSVSFDDTKTVPAGNIAQAPPDELDMVIHSMSDIEIEEVSEAVPQPVPHPMERSGAPPSPPPPPPASRRAPSNPPLPPPVPTPTSMDAVAPPETVVPPGPPGPPMPSPGAPVPPPLESMVVEMPRQETQPVEPEQLLFAEVSVRPKKKGKASPVIIGLLVLAIVGGGGFVIYDRFIANKASAKKTANGPAKVIDAGTAPPAASPDAAAVVTATNKTADAGAAVKSSTDAGAVQQPVDAAPTPKPPVDAAVVAVSKEIDAAPKVVAVAGKLTIRSTPSGAKVYLDGTYKGKTPQTLEASPDSHRLALIKAGHKLHTAKIEGTGLVNVPLKTVTPPGGPGGIKVRCKRKNRYYVFVNGDDMGMVCPTERIGVKKGKHVVEIYDPVTDARRTFKVTVKQTRNSMRVYVD